MAVQWCLSDKPRKLRDQIKRETFLTEELIIKSEAERARSKLSDDQLLNSGSLRKRNTHSSEFSEDL